MVTNEDQSINLLRLWRQTRGEKEDNKNFLKNFPTKI